MTQGRDNKRESLCAMPNTAPHADSSPGPESRGSPLLRRYAVKLLSNAATMPLYLLLEVILPRALGPAGYGDYSFITGLFQQLTGFLDMGTSTCLSTSLAKSPGDFRLAAFYARVAGLMLGLCLAAGLVLWAPLVGSFVLPGVPGWMILPAALWGFLFWASRVARAMNDALGITTQSELVRIGVNLFSVLLIIVLFYGGWLSMGGLFAQQYLTMALLLSGFILTMSRVWPVRRWSLSRRDFSGIAGKFRAYSAPLFVIALTTALGAFADRWVLQYFNGSEEQGFFSLSAKISAGCFLFVSPMIPLLLRELSIAHGRGDAGAMAGLLGRVAPKLYTVSAWLCCFTAVEAAMVVRLFGGQSFASALWPARIMAFFPLHLVYLQAASAVFYAMAETARLRNLTVIFYVGGMILSWFCVAPAGFAGLGLGAAGLAGKMVLVQLAMSVFLLKCCQQLTGFRLGRNLAHQALCVALFLAAAALARAGTTEFWPLPGLEGADSYARFVLSGFIYTVLCALIGLCFPFSAGSDRAELAVFFAKIFRKTRS